jgi:ammonia channel protein AmtB
MRVALSQLVVRLAGAVHMMGGVAGLAGAWVAGPRKGRFDANGKPVAMVGHNAVLYMAGVLLLWFGFYVSLSAMISLCKFDGLALLCTSTIANIIGGCAIVARMSGAVLIFHAPASRTAQGFFVPAGIQPWYHGPAHCT